MYKVLSICNNIHMDKQSELFEKIAINVRSFRFVQKLSQEQLAERSGLSVNCISNIENAKQNIQIGTLLKVAKALNKELKDFI